MKTLLQIKFYCLYFAFIASIAAWAFSFHHFGMWCTGFGLVAAISLREQIKAMYRI